MTGQRRARRARGGGRRVGRRALRRWRGRDDPRGYDLPARGYRGRLALRGLDASVELAVDDELVVLARAATAACDGDAPDVHGHAGAPAMAPRAGPAVVDLLGAIRDGRETEAPIDALVRALEVIDAAYRSARTGRLVRLEDP